MEGDLQKETIRKHTSTLPQRRPHFTTSGTEAAYEYGMAIPLRAEIEKMILEREFK